MSRTRLDVAACLALTLVAGCAAVRSLGGRDGTGEPTLIARALLAADAYQPGPPSGAFISADNGATPPFPSQVLPGFSAVLGIDGETFRAMPDNGFGSKANSGDFLLRV